MFKSIKLQKSTTLFLFVILLITFSTIEGKTLEKYSKGKNIEELANQFNCTKLTIKRNLKKNIEKEEYNQTTLHSERIKEISSNKNSDSKSHMFDDISNSSEDLIDSFSEKAFVEIAPLEYEIDNILYVLYYI